MKKLSGGLHSVSGFRFAGVSGGIKKSGEKDIALIVSDTLSDVAGVFTKNRIKAAPVIWCQGIARTGKARAILVSSGNANACTGSQGQSDVEDMAGLAGELMGERKRKILVCSTGVIGAPLPMEKVRRGIRLAVAGLSRRGGKSCAEAIMTTDTFPKSSAVEADMGGLRFRIGGISKGSGMIYPNMATMLSFLVTDVNISSPLLKKALKEAVNETFNMITVDGDTSTNDTILILAGGRAGNTRLEKEGVEYREFLAALKYVMNDLAGQVVRDGEGATTVIRVKILGARSITDARKIALKISNSNLVKTAVFGNDANWGRIVMAAGNAGAKIEFDRLDLLVGNVRVLHKGAISDPCWEKKVTGLLKKREVLITLDLNLGPFEAEALTTDLTYDYIKINASYRS